MLPPHDIGFLCIRSNHSVRYHIGDISHGELMFTDGNHFKSFFREYLKRVEYNILYKRFRIENLNESFITLEERHNAAIRNPFELYMKRKNLNQNKKQQDSKLKFEFKESYDKKEKLTSGL